jgi:hypothetical protein
MAQTQAIALAVPVMNADESAVLGILRAFVDVAAFHPMLSEVKPSGGETKLVAGDGTVITNPGRDHVRREPSEEMEVVGPLLENNLHGAVVVPVRGGHELFVGYASVGLRHKYPELDWAVLLSQDLSQVSQPIETAHQRALASGFLGILIVGVLAVYFSTHRPQPPLDPMDELLKE